MDIRLRLLAGLMMIAFAPRPAAAGNDTAKKAAKETIRLGAKCAKEAVKDLRDVERDRRNPRPDNKWDELCAPPPPPPAPDPVVVPPPVLPPPIMPPPIMMPPPP